MNYYELLGVASNATTDEIKRWAVLVHSETKGRHSLEHVPHLGAEHALILYMTGCRAYRKKALELHPDK